MAPSMMVDAHRRILATMADSWQMLTDARQGARDAFEALIRAQTDRLYTLASRITGDPALAEDVVQETFLRVLRGRSPLLARGSAEAWLARVAMHIAIDEVRSRQARKRREVRHAMAAREELHLDDSAERQEWNLHLAEGFAALTLETRAAVWLHVVEGESGQRVAECLGCREHTAYRRIRSGLDDLRRFLARKGHTLSAVVPLADLLRRLPGDRAPDSLLARLEELGASLPAPGPAASIPDPGAAGPSAGTLEKVALGVAIMSGKKLAVSVAIAILVLLAGGLFIAGPFRESGGRTARPPAEPAPTAARETAEGKRAAPLDPAEAKPVAAPKAALEAPSRGSLLVRVRWEDDGSPAVGICLQIVSGPERGESRPSRCSPEAIHAVTGPDGTARADGLPPGRVDVYVDRTERSIGAEVHPGEMAEADIRIPPGITVNGTVVDEGGEPVPGATILLSGLEHDCAVRSARSDPDGRFVLRSVRPGLKIGARAEGHAPSFLQEVQDAPGEAIEVELVLQGPGGSLRGIVKGWEKGPLAGAAVRVTDARVLENHDAGLLISPISERARTDAEGRFSIDGLAAGDVEVLITAAGHDTFHELVEVKAEGPTEKEFVLGPGETIEGTVRWPDGKPAAGAWVTRGYEYDKSIQTAGDGSYSMKDLPHGRVMLMVSCRGARAEKTFELVTGETVRWDPVLAGSKDISGRVLDEEGVPLLGWSVGAKDDPFRKGAMYSAEDPTDANGQFRIVGCRDLTYLVSTYAPGCKYPSALVKGIRPGTEDVVIQVPRDALPSAYVQGTVLDPEGKPAAGARICPHSSDAGLGISHYAGDGGRFRIGPLPPGRYDVSVEFGEFPTRRFPERALGAGEILDLGVVPMSRGGFFRARILGEDGGPPPARPGLHIEAEDGSFWKALEIARDGTAGIGPLEPKAYVLQIMGRDIAWAERPVEIREDATTEVDVVVRRGVRRTLRLAAAGSVKLGVVRLVVRDADGNGVLRTNTSDSEGEGRLDIGWICLAPGSYAVEASTETGFHGQGKFEVLDLTERKDPVEVELK